MINPNTLEQAVPLSQLLAEKDKTLTVIQGTPMDAVMKTCSTYELHVEGQSFDTLQTEDVIGFLAGKCNAKDDDGKNEHNGAVNGVVEEAGRAVQQSLSFARNSVVPDIKDVLVKIDEVCTGIRSNLNTPYEIQPLNVPSIFTNGLLHELVDRFSQTTAVSVERKEIVELPLELVISSIATGAGRFDGEVEKELSRNDNEGYIACQGVFAGKILLENIPAIYAVGVHLLCKALYDNPVDGIRLSLNDYNLHLAKLIEQSGRQIYQEIERGNKRVKLGLMYEGAALPNGSGYTIYVNNEVYLGMLEKGLTPEVVMGNEFLGRRYNDSQLVEKAEELTTVYNREMRMRTLQTNLEETNRCREAISRVLALEIVNRDDDQLPVDRATLQKRLNDKVALIQDKDLDNLPVLVRDLVCFVFYAHTDSLRILTLIDNIGAKYPEIDAREAALLASIEYVAFWVSKQMVVA